MLKLVTVLFADVVGSTTRAERMHPEDTRALMGEYFEAMADEIRGEGGTIEKFVGDAIMAVFGVPRTHEDDAVRAVRAAGRMLVRLEDWNAERDEAEKIEIRIGINTGDVIAAGAPTRDLLVTGDAVNIAARLQELAEPGTIVVGERTARAVRAQFELRPLDAQTLKGKSVPVQASVVEAKRDVVETRGVPGLMAPLVGRGRELELLRSTLARAQEERHPHLVTIVGDAGVGKSRLMREFIASLDVATKVVFGRCLPYGQGVTLWPLVEILKAEATILDTDDTDLALAKIRALVRETISPDLLADEERAVAALASTIGLQGEDDPLAELGPRELYRELLGVWRALLAGLAAGGAVVAVVEDIHWADETMLRLLEELAERGEGPLLFLCPARPDLLRTRPDWGGGRRNALTVSLDPLSQEESEQLVSLLLEVDDLPMALRSRMLERSEGNPFFLEEIVHRLIDEGLLLHEGERWRAREGVADVEVPDNVQAVILARLDLLAPEERRLAQAASVIGRVFWAGAAGRLVNAVDVDEILETLRRRELVLERLASSIAGDVEYIFKHVLIRDVAYESLPRKERARLHTEAARWIEETAGERAAELAELLAHHYDAASTLAPDDRLREQARVHYLDAARNAARRNALGQLERFGRRAVELAPEPARRLEALELMGDLYFLAFHGDGAWAAYTDALADLGDEDEAYARLAGKAAIISGRWTGSMVEQPSFEELDELIDRGLAAAGEATPERALLLISRAFMQLQYFRRDERLEPALREGLEIAERLDDPDLLSTGLDATTTALESDGRYDEGWKTIERRLALVPRQRDVKEIGDAYAMAAWNAVHRGLYATGERYATECIERGIGVDTGTQLHGLTWRARARFALGDWDGALADQRELEQLQEEDARDLPPGYTMGSYTVAALCHELRGERAEADRYLEIARRFVSRVSRGTVGSMHAPAAARALAHRGSLDEASALVPPAERSTASGRSLEVQCEIAAERGDWVDVEALLARARVEAAECGLLALPFYADRLEGRQLAAHGEPNAGAELLLRSAEGFAQLGAAWEEAWSRLLAAEALLVIDVGRARDESAMALPTFERLRSIVERERARRVLERVTV